MFKDTCITFCNCCVIWQLPLLRKIEFTVGRDAFYVAVWFGDGVFGEPAASIFRVELADGLP